jgi:signal transduction histidine kinase
MNLKEFLSGIKGSMEQVFREKGLRLSLVDRGDLRVVTDPEKLERILKNIISNSLKYTEKGGVRMDYEVADGSFVVEVKDTGIGIAEEEIPQIFKRFYRGKGLSDSGTGIGLAIVKELVDVMGGSIDVRSSTEHGTTFRIRLPDKGP